MYQYTIGGDTVINSQDYKILIKTGYSPCNHTTNLGPPYVGAFRDDTVAQKVYFVPPDSLNEQVLFDFSLHVGDTIKGYLYNGYTTVSNIDTVVLGGIARRRFEYSTISINPYYIEGIGNLCGLFQPLDLMDEGYLLVCFTHNGITIYPDSLQSCLLVDEVQDFQQTTRIEITPNPFSSQLKISAQNDLIKAVLVYDVTGNLILKQNCSDYSVSLKIEDTGRGLLFCRLIMQNGTITSIKAIAY